MFGIVSPIGEPAQPLGTKPRLACALFWRAGVHGRLAASTHNHSESPSWLSSGRDQERPRVPAGSRYLVAQSHQCSPECPQKLNEDSPSNRRRLGSQVKRRTSRISRM